MTVEQLLLVPLPDEAALADDHQPVGGHLHLGQQVRRHQHRASFFGESTDHGANPSDAIGVESVDGFVEDEMAGVTEHCGRQAESLFHAQREAADSFGGDRFEANERQAFVGTCGVDGRGSCHGPEVRASGELGVHPAGVEHGADDSGWCTVAGQRAAIDEGFAVVDAVEAEHAAHCGRFSGAVGAEEPGDCTVGDGEREVFDDAVPAVGLGELVDFEHDFIVAGSRAHGIAPRDGFPGSISRAAVVPRYECLI